VVEGPYQWEIEVAKKAKLGIGTSVAQRVFKQKPLPA
jgi:hypothetical protein